MAAKWITIISGTIKEKTMKWLLVVIVIFFLSCSSGCSVNPKELSAEYVQDFANKVKCATGYKGRCWCFVASRKTGSTATTGIGMALAPDELCK